MRCAARAQRRKLRTYLLDRRAKIADGRSVPDALSDPAFCEDAGLDVLGFVLSQPKPTTDESAATNASTIETLTDMRCVAVLSHGDVDSAADALVALAARL